ncbi:hypothetical protein SAMN05421636_102428 [Pricia antarctica]|uniref:Uncharacterized protein n=1 Tax=Pricia antarctica TaxID=641691 RepID=A0A1G6YZ70_9FLAO|nr:hypothetical protein [Pricia antarctica]SDD95660.1 hypothetical protein SAMN05421636_102428 [Pricia antarctica]
MPGNSTILKKDPKELTNSSDDEAYADVVQMMHKKLDSVQKVYKVTEREFEQVPKETVERANKMFDKLRGSPFR